MKNVLLLIGFVLAITASAAADMSAGTLEKEHLARYSINYAGYLIDVGKYMEALESYETAAEVTAMAKTKADALLSRATLLTSFLDAPDQALRIYRQMGRGDDAAAQTALYRQGFLLFELQRLPQARAILADYRRRFPEGLFRFQVEALEKQIARAPVPLPPAPTPLPPPPTPPAAKPKTPTLRVRVAYTAGVARIEGTKVCASGLGCKERFTLGVSDGKLRVDGAAVSGNTLAFESEKPLGVINGQKMKKLRGKLVAGIKSGRLLVNNVVDIEDYLLAVVPSENPASWPMETLKAQAVAARTYAYYQLLHRKNRAYDLVDYAGDQAYGGMDKEHPRSSAAVKKTSGVILTYADKPILAMFSANSGGHTADARAVFDLGKPYLVARKDPASLKGQMADWTRKFTTSQIVTALGKINIDATGLEAIEAEERGPSGRIVKVRLVLENAADKVLRNRTTLRRALDLPEILHDIDKQGDSFVFNGHGWGHGVGYSQWGSAYLGKEKNYREILAFYYGDARMQKLW